MNTANRMIRNVALLTFIGLAACGSLTTSDIPANQTWWLVPYENSGQLTHTGALDRVTVEVTVVPGLDNNRILTLTGDAELNRYAAARWADNLPELVTSLVGRTLAASGRFNVTTGLDGGPGENCVLQLEVREFFAELARHHHRVRPPGPAAGAAQQAAHDHDVGHGWHGGGRGPGVFIAPAGQHLQGLGRRRAPPRPAGARPVAAVEVGKE